MQVTTPQDQIIAAVATVFDKDLIKPQHIESGDFSDLETDEGIYRAYRCLVSGRYRAKLKKHGIEVPDLSPPLKIVDSGIEWWTVQNPIKGSRYEVTRDGFTMRCTCDAARFGNYCSHMAHVEHHAEILDDDNPVFAGDDHPSHDEASEMISDSAIVEAIKDAAPMVIHGDGTVEHVDDELPTSPYNAALQDVVEEMNITPTADQWAALHSLIAWWGKNEPFYLLRGYAGTGKTTIINVFIRYLRRFEALPPTIALTAPTNKAVKVCDRMVSRWGIENLEAMTCARLLALRPVRVENKQDFKPDPKVDPAIDLFDLIVVDEASMVSESLFGYLLDESGKFYPRQHRFILMGDPAQLPPVGEAESASFHWVKEPAHQTELTEVVRYSGELGKLATYLRSNQNKNQSPVITTAIDVGSDNGVYVLPRGQWGQVITSAFQSSAYDADPNYCRVLAWRNKRANYINNLARVALGRVGEYCEGERVVANSPFMAGNTVLWANSSEGEVIGVIDGTVEGWQVWMLTCAIEGGEIQTVPVLQGCEKRRFDAELEKLSREKRWFSFWGLKEKFADLNYAYALTVHKSQGSTFQNVFVDMADINANRKVNTTQDKRRVFERWQLAYVGITRASERAIVLT